MRPFAPMIGQAPNKKKPGELIHNIKPLLKELMAPRWPRLVLGLLLVMIGRAAGLVAPASTRFLVDDIIAKRHLELLAPLTLGILGASMIQACCSFGVTNIVSKEGLRLVADLRLKVQDHVGRLPVTYFDSTKAGVLSSRIIADVEGGRHLMGNMLVEFIGGLITALFALIYLLGISVPLTGAALLAAVTFAFVSKKNFQRIRPVFREAGKIQGEVSGRLIESLSGIRVVKGYGAEARESATFAAGVERIFENGWKTSKSMSIMGASSTLVLGVVSAGIMYLAARQIFAGSLTLGGFMTFTAFVSFLMGPMFALSGIGAQLTESMAGLDRTMELLREKREDQNPRRVDAMGPIEGLVSFEHVNFSYKEGNPVLHDVTFESRPGTVTALVGSSGSGKSTIIGLVTAFHDPSEGVVRVDDKDIATVRLDTFRTQLGVVLQDTFLFDGSIRENVAFARPDAPEEEILRACQIAHVSEFAEKMPQQYDTVIGERGVKLSGGQRQRLSIARAIVANPRILILDEATSSLDSESEAAIQEGLAYLMEGRTTFVIAHRLSTIHRANQILVIEGGRIVERGTHEELNAAKGRYHDLLSRQQAGGNMFLAPGEGVAKAPAGPPMGLPPGMRWPPMRPT